MIDIKELSELDLKQKIENIKAEREKTADALKRYEEELERRKREVPLGVPIEKNLSYRSCFITPNGEVICQSLDYNKCFDKPLFAFLNCFPSRESARKHAEMLLEWRKALVANAKGESIDIKVLCPLLKKGKVLYSPYDEKWKWVEQDAIVFAEEHGWYIKKSQVLPIEGFNIKPAKNWEHSLMECGL